MSRRIGLLSLYLAAAVATAVTTAIPLAMPPAAGLTFRPPIIEPTRPYIVTARNRAAARDLVGAMRWRVRRFYTAAIPGFATWVNTTELAELRADPRVLAIEPDREIHPMPITAPDRAWLITGPAHQIHSRSTTGPNRARVARGTGRGVTVYIVDSGVNGQPGTATVGLRRAGGFGDRAWRAFDATGRAGDDCGGHGTRVARAIAGRSHGVAPRARIASVRVLGCGGSGSLSDVLAGLDWVRRHAHGPAVANLSIDGARSRALRTAMARLTRSGVFVVASADTGGCRLSPTGETYSTRSPYLAGAAARYLELHPDANPSVLASWLKCTATRDTIRQNPSRASRTGRP
ncbi:S8 family serine peptidase [Nonomuraea sp. NEAU-A123]|uniref:S8 family serine peptidase n=1 Tax=Nonomuraea sp. NEAU-A123 TaxID=2839649 RepID=UPI001BE44E6E|nr:S8 family serine peptidase [Nonomuraea sp. NEAU-A123]MBT2226981.1 S8 family serine peptidase [Nonomuraea sp. NEAU-A123]